jgi:hypothetical protein
MLGSLGRRSSQHSSGSNKRTSPVASKLSPSVKLLIASISSMERHMLLDLVLRREQTFNRFFLRKCRFKRACNVGCSSMLRDRVHNIFGTFVKTSCGCRQHEILSEDRATLEMHYSPVENLEALDSAALRNAQSTIDLCAYSLTDP